MIFPILLAFMIIVIAVLSIMEFRHFQQARNELQDISDIAILTAQASRADDKDVLDDLARTVLVDMKFESPVQMDSQIDEDSYSIALSALHNPKNFKVFGLVPNYLKVTSEIMLHGRSWSWSFDSDVRSLFDLPLSHEELAIILYQIDEASSKAHFKYQHSGHLNSRIDLKTLSEMNDNDMVFYFTDNLDQPGLCETINADQGGAELVFIGKRTPEVRDFLDGCLKFHHYYGCGRSPLFIERADLIGKEFPEILDAFGTVRIAC